MKCAPGKFSFQGYLTPTLHPPPLSAQEPGYPPPKCETAEKAYVVGARDEMELSLSDAKRERQNDRQTEMMDGFLSK